MPVNNPSRFRHWVGLSNEEHPSVTLSPARVKCSIEPAPPSQFDERGITHLVEMRYHPGVDLNTLITFVDRAGSTHKLYVRGYQNVAMQSRALSLLCEEVQTPS